LKSLTLASLVLSPAALAGCGGGGSTPAATTAAVGTGTPSAATTAATPTPSAATPPAPAPTPETQTIANTTGYAIDYYGDSTIKGLDQQNGGTVQSPAPFVFDQTLQTTLKHSVSNQGVNSTTCVDLLNGIDGAHPEWSIQMASTSANVVIVNHGINDSLSETLDQYKSCLTSLVTIARQKGKKVVLETPNPTPHLPGVADYAAAMKSVAATLQVPVIDQFQNLTDYMAKNPNAEVIGPDGVHPTQQGYTLKGQYAAQVFPSFKL
jgi:lysophospholipase L1-like esterase